MKIKVINGKEYIATKLVRLNDIIYQEYCSANIMMPHTLYMEENEDKLVTRWKTYLALREKYAIDRRMLSGKLVLDSGGLEVEFTEEQQQLDKLFEQDVAEFSERAAQAWWHIVKKHDPQVTDVQTARVWFEKKFRGNHGYIIDPSIEKDGPAATCDENGIIRFKSLAYAQDKLFRAHEMAHKLGFGPNRAGLMVYFKHTVRDDVTGELHEIHSENGRALNEGVTNWMAQILAGVSVTQEYDEDDPYYEQEKLARKVMGIVGKDTVVEAALFNPDILREEFDRCAGERNAYAALINAADGYQIADKESDKAVCEKEAGKSYEASLSELDKADRIINRAFTRKNQFRNREK